MKNIVAIIGSASENSSNHKLVQYIAAQTKDSFLITIYESLRTLPHFSPELSIANTPQAIINCRQMIAKADGIIISTPEYIFSIPSGLKNLLEWCVSTTVFSGKPLAVVTASANGRKGHEELLLIMQTLMANFTRDTALLIQGIKGKINDDNQITDSAAQLQIHKMTEAFLRLVIEP